MQKNHQNSQTNTTLNGIDKNDAQIIEILRTDARIPNTRLAEKIGLSPTATQARVERLQHDGIIRYYWRLWTTANSSVKTWRLYK